jgi:hypothetical protein
LSAIERVAARLRRNAAVPVAGYWATVGDAE